MERIRRHSEAEAIEHVLSTLPLRLLDRLNGVQFIAECDPLYMGLHTYVTSDDGRPYSGTSHVAWECHQGQLPAADRRTTVVLLGGAVHDPLIVLHELGHALDERLGFPSARLPVLPLDSYAETNCFEAFATAFQSWATHRPTSESFFHDREFVSKRDPRTVAFFDSLVLGGAV